MFAHNRVHGLRELFITPGSRNLLSDNHCVPQLGLKAKKVPMSWNKIFFLPARCPSEIVKKILFSIWILTWGARGHQPQVHWAQRCQEAVFFRTLVKVLGKKTTQTIMKEGPINFYCMSDRLFRNYRPEFSEFCQHYRPSFTPPPPYTILFNQTGIVTNKRMFFSLD